MSTIWLIVFMLNHLQKSNLQFCNTCRLPKGVGDWTGLLVRQCLAIQWSGKMPSRVWVPGGSGGPGGPGRQYTLTILLPPWILVSPKTPPSLLRRNWRGGEWYCYSRRRTEWWCCTSYLLLPPASAVVPPTSKAWPENCHMMAMTQPQETNDNTITKQQIRFSLCLMCFPPGTTDKGWVLSSKCPIVCLNVQLQCQSKSIKQFLH